MNDFITEHDLDFMNLTETWLDNSNSAPVFIESTLPNFNSMNVSKANRKGGVAPVFNDSFQCKHPTCGDFDSF